jgi:hypothetical protein
MDEPKPEETLSSQSKKTEFLDPVTTMTIWAVAWFVIKSSLQAIIGWVALNFFKRLWAKRKGEDAAEQFEQGVFEEGEEQET